MVRKNVLTAKGKKIKRAMKEEYGPEKGTQVFHASKNKGTISGVDKPAKSSKKRAPARRRGGKR